MKTRATPSASARNEKLARRLAHVLDMLYQGDDLDKRQLAEQFGVDVRTIERDLGERLRGIAGRNAEGRWQLIRGFPGKISAQRLHEYAQLAGTGHLFPDDSLPYLLEQLDATPARRGLHVQPVATEDLRGKAGLYRQLQSAIQQRHTCRFTYNAKPRHVRPYRLHHQNGVWYLAAAEAPGDALKSFSVSRIEDLSVDSSSRFTPKPEHLARLDRQHDVWAGAESTEVLLRVAPAVARYFTRRPLLPQQQQRKASDGSLLVTTHIHHPRQLLPVVRYWLPHVRILQPAQLHEALVDELRQALTLWDAPAAQTQTRHANTQTVKPKE